MKIHQDIESYITGCNYMRSRRPKMPKMRFPSDMIVEPLIPVRGTTLRFRLNGYNVHLNHFVDLGFMAEPHWEVFDGAYCHRFDVDNWSGMLDFVISLGQGLE
jgi:hypothetical protein